MNHNLAFSKKRFYTYLNYGLAFILSLFFLIYAKKLNLINLNKYILVISLSAVFASVIYSTSIKSEYEKGLILIGITDKTLYLLFFFSLIVAIYLGYKNTFLVIFFYLNIFYEICFNLILIYFVKNNKTFFHSQFQLLNAFIRNLLLFFLSFYFNNILPIVSIFYILFIIVFLFVFKYLNIKFKSIKRSFKIIDLFYVITGSLIFQVDKILGESLLSKDNYFVYFIIYKISSIFQIAGSILFQPIRNKLISEEKITRSIKIELNFLTKILVLLIIIINMSILGFKNINLLVEYQNYLDLNKILIFNFFCIAFILHTYNGFYIDALFINNFAKNLFFLNIFVLMSQFIIMLLSQSLLIWSFSIMIGQLVLLIFPMIKYNKNV